MEAVLENTLPVAKKMVKVKLPIGRNTLSFSLVDKYSLNTICASGSCPNMGECWAKELHFMILGNTCTRSCGFVV
jgi:lipoic acid synthetase